MALDARAVGGGLGSCLLIEFGEAALASSPRGHVYARANDSEVLTAIYTETFPREPRKIKVVAVLRFCGTPVRGQLFRELGPLVKLLRSCQ
jgi:hypothetical protein